MTRPKQIATMPWRLPGLINGSVQRLCLACLMVLTGWLVMSLLVPAQKQVVPQSKVTPAEDVAPDLGEHSVEMTPPLQAIIDFSLVDFPSPPPLVTQIPNQQTREYSSGVVEKDPQLHAREPISASNERTEHKLQATKKIDLTGYSRYRLENTGLDMLHNLTDRKGPNIEFSWPESSSEKELIAEILHKCMGVSLGKVSANGTFSAREIESVDNSPFVRTIIGNVSQDESKTLSQWRNLPGQAVRLYPLKADARLLGGLKALLAQDLNGLMIRGRYTVDGSGLKIINITTNGQTQQGELMVSANCL